MVKLGLAAMPTPLSTLLRLSVAFLALTLLNACELRTTTPTPRAYPIVTGAGNATAVADTLSASSVEPVATSKEVEMGVGGLSKEINPLTGLPMVNAEILGRRPVAVKISNYPRSNRPQWGLSLADIVYEYYHNNELTRFHAIFYGKDAFLAGPIRSARLLDDRLTDIYGSLLVFASADARIFAQLEGRHPAWQLVSILEGNCPPQPVCRYDPLGHDYLVANTAEVGEYVEAVGGDNGRQALEGMSFDVEAPAGGEEVGRIYLRYSYSAYAYWDYDAASGRYLRYQDAWEDLGGRGESYQLLTDRLNDQPIQADTVVVLYVSHFHEVYKPASNGLPATEIVDMDFEGRGTAYAFRDGMAYELEWVVEEGKVLYLVDAEGKAFPFKPGSTWFQVMNDRSRLDAEGDIWYFTFIFRRP